jgi:bifunctional UDP-N-acetylglucosamine pyrophosphorylase/glucosamine-1-phosphate N-acetyltransferase
VLEPFTILRGSTEIGEECHVGPYAEITDSVLEDGVRVTHSWLSGARVGRGSDCGPYAKLRAGAEIAPDVHVGSFAEVVRSRVGSGSAIPHFSYVGDATIGQNVNVAAGTITANYDGENKNPTVIEDGVFVGVDTMFVAPVRIGRGSKTGAGSVVTKDVPPDSMAVGVPARVTRRLQKDDPPERTEG